MIIVASHTGQHASVVFEAAILAGLTVTGIASAGEDPASFSLGCPFLGHVQDLASGNLEEGPAFIVATGSNKRRQEWQQWLGARGARFESIIHPAAIVSPTASIGAGSVVLAGAIVGTRAVIGRGAIINHSASVDHDCCLGDFVNVSPGARLAGTVRCESRVFIGMNASVLQGLHVAQDSTVGAGAVVTRNVAAASTVLGVPAKSRGN